MQWASRDAVLIFRVAAHDGAETLHVEESVLQIERIEGPFNQADTAGERILALEKLEAAADAGIAVFRQHAQHVAVQVRRRTGLDAGDGEAESDQAVAVVSAENVAAHFVEHHQKSHGQQVDRIEAPDLFLQLDHAGELG